MPLRDRGMSVTVLRPVPWRGGSISAAADMVEQGEGWPLPGDLYPILQRNPLDSFGPDAAHWQVVPPAEPAGNSTDTDQPCLFEVLPSDDGAAVVHWMVTHDPAVRQYLLSSNDLSRTIPNITTIPVDPSTVAGQLNEYSWKDSAVEYGTERYYWLAAEYEDGRLQDLGFTNPLTVYRMVRLPLVSR